MVMLWHNMKLDNMMLLGGYSICLCGRLFDLSMWKVVKVQ